MPHPRVEQEACPRILRRSPEVLLEGRDLVRGYGPQRVLRGIDLEIREGDRAALIGRNGAGKTTLLRVLSRLLHLEEGVLQYRDSGTSVLLISDSSTLVPKWNALQCARFLGGADPAIDRAVIQEEFERFGVSKFADQPVGTYSLGMGRRLMFALSALLKPNILLLDEPFLGLDAASIAVAISYLEKLSPSQAMVLATHHPVQAIELCDLVLRLVDGHLYSEGRVQDINAMDVVTTTPHILVQALREAGIEADRLSQRRYRVTTTNSMGRTLELLSSSGCEILGVEPVVSTEP